MRLVGQSAVDERRAGLRPAVLVAPGGLVLDEFTRRHARRTAELGYITFALDYDRADRVSNELARQLDPRMDDPEPLRDISRAARAVLATQEKTDPQRVAAVGYCYGGQAVLELARSGWSCTRAATLGIGMTPSWSRYRQVWPANRGADRCSEAAWPPMLWASDASRQMPPVPPTTQEPGRLDVPA